MTVCVIGDVVASRELPDQRRLLRGLAMAVDDLAGARSAAATTGDEFQAVFDHLGTAVRSLAELRLRLLDDPPADAPVELRLGLGVGEITGDPSDAGAAGQSGPGWWYARAALDHVAEARVAWPKLRWWLEADSDVAAPRAVLVALDTLGARFDELDVSLARGVLRGSTARDLAVDHGITPQSVGGRLRTHGIYGWVRALETLAEETT